MNKLSIHRHYIVAMIGILALILSLGNSGQALAAQNTADLSISMVADKSRVKIGENIVYTVTATNLGPNDALFVGVYHGLPDQLNFVSLTCAGGISSSGAFCEYPILTPGASVVSTLIVTPRPDLRNYERKSLTATAVLSSQTGDTVDPNSSNNLASVTIKLIGKPTHP